MIIGGAALGSVLIATPLKVLKGLVKALPRVFTGAGPSRVTYLELLALLYDLFAKARKEGMLALDGDVQDPAESKIFAKYPRILKSHAALEFLCDSVRLVSDGAVRPAQLEELLDAAIETHHEEASRNPTVLARVGDSLPGLGIVAAVLGIVITMQHIDGPPEEIGHKVAVALVGTFLGILLCYGFVGPVASHLESLAQDDDRVLRTIKAGLVAFTGGASPTSAVELARRVIMSCDRPSSEDMIAARSGSAAA